MDLFDSHNRSVTETQSCLNFTVKTGTDVLYIKTTLGSFTVLANLVAIAVILFTKRFKEFTFRLVIYLLVTDIFQAIVIMLELIPVQVPDESHAARIRNGIGWLIFCDATGFLGMVTLWMGNIVIIWIVIYLVVLGRRLYYRKQATNNQSNSWKREALGVLALLLVPILIGLVPFTIDGNMYGISGLWCWIKIVKHNDGYCGELHYAPLKLVLVLYYGPLVLVVIFSVVCMVITICFVCCGAVKRHPGKTNQTTKTFKRQGYMKDIMLVLLYPVLYCAVCMLLLANRVFSSVHYSKQPIVGLWITHAVADPVRVLLPALAFLFHPYVWKPHKKQDDQQQRGHEDSSVNDDDRTRLTNPNLGNGITTYGSCDDADNSNKVLSSVVVDHHHTA